MKKDHTDTIKNPVLFCSTKRIRNVFITAFIAGAVIFTGQNLFAQTTIEWNGTISSDALTPDNWTPSGNLEGNILSIDSAYKFTNNPVISGATDITVNNMLLKPTSSLTINMTNTENFVYNSTETPDLFGTINIENGTLRIRRCEIDDSNSIVNVMSGGILQTEKYLFFGGNSSPTFGGFLNISGTGIVRHTNTALPGRFPSDSTKGIVTITDEGMMDIRGDWSADAAALVARGQITSTTDRDIVIKYNAEIGRTTIYSRDKMAFLVEPESAQKLVANTSGEVLRVVKNDGHASMVSFQWKYGTVSGGPYDQVVADQTGDTIVPSFATPGNYYLVCVGNNGTTDVTSNEVFFLISSDKVQVTPAEKQKLKLTQQGYMLTVTETETADSREWKYTTTSGSAYQSFASPVTGTELTPEFDATGTYYIICQSTIGGQPLNSTEVEIEVVDTNDVFDITWLGEYSENTSDMRNWFPIAHIHKNNLVILGDTPNDPVLSTAGNDTINGFSNNIAAGAVFTIEKAATDTLYKSGDQYLAGELIVNSGVFVIDGRLRPDANTSRIQVNGGEILMTIDFIVGGNNSPNGAEYVKISGDGILDAGAQIWRFATDTTRSIIELKDDAKLIIHADWTSSAQTYIDKLQIKGADGWEVLVTYPYMYKGDSVTLITARELIAFNIQPLTKQVVAIGEAAAELSTINDAAIVSREWKYSTTSGSGYVSFNPAQTGNTCAPLFANADSYYVICEGNTGTETVMSSEVNIVAVSVTIAPTDAQTIEEMVAGTKLTVTETQTASSREWKYSTTSGSGYQSFFPQAQTGAEYTPLFQTAGTYYIICSSVIEGITITSNEVMVTVTHVSGVEDNAINSITLYPNPAQGEVFINPANIVNFRIEVLDIQGRVVLNQEFVNVTGIQKINLTDKGLYVIKFYTDEMIKVTRLVIE
jgi:hypothetical protein